MINVNTNLISLLPSLPQSEKLVLYVLLLTIVVIGLQKHYTNTEVGAGLELYHVYCLELYHVY
jgi:hypothetical protein